MNDFLQKHRNFIALITDSKAPKTFKEAMKHEAWRESMATEIDALKGQGTWVLEKLPP